MMLRTRGRLNVKRWSRLIADRVRGTEFDRMLAAARREDRREFVFAWNRGLGDIALGLVPLFARIREAIPESRIVVLTRPDLADAFSLAGVDAIHAIAGLARDARIDIAAEARRARIALAADANVVADPDPTRWLEGWRDRYPPVLHWQRGFDAQADALVPHFPADVVIGAHVHSETAQYYGYVKDWPAQRWQSLVSRFPASRNVRWLLFGNAKGDAFAQDNVVDLRGRTSFISLLAVIRTRCRVLVAPDSGVLTAAYYLEGSAPLEVVSLWSDPRQGILKQRCPSPNPNLRHAPLVGRDEDVRNLTVDDVAAAVDAAVARQRRISPLSHAEAD
jgi:ADP-heptose:LPS heptosyltransferase